MAAALAAGCSVLPHSRNTLEFCLAWDMPKITFGSGEREHRRYSNTERLRARETYHRSIVFLTLSVCVSRRYTRYFGTGGDASPVLSHFALTHYRQWEKSIEEWQRPILQDR